MTIKYTFKGSADDVGVAATKELDILLQIKHGQEATGFVIPPSMAADLGFGLLRSIADAPLAEIRMLAKPLHIQHISAQQAPANLVSLQYSLEGDIQLETAISADAARTLYRQLGTALESIDALPPSHPH